MYCSSLGTKPYLDSVRQKLGNLTLVILIAKKLQHNMAFKKKSNFKITLYW